MKAFLSQNLHLSDKIADHTFDEVVAPLLPQLRKLFDRHLLACEITPGLREEMQQGFDKMIKRALVGSSSQH